MNVERWMVGRIWRAAMVLACVAAATAALVASPAAAKRSATAKGPVAGRLDPGFGKAGKALVAFPAENAGDVGVKYDLPFQFSAGHLVMATSPGGKFVVAGASRVVRLLANGKPDPRFGSGGVVSIPRPPGRSFVLAGVAVDSQSRVLLAGSSRPLPTGAVPDPLLSAATVLRLNADGSPDTSFGDGGTLISDFGIKPPVTNTGPYSGAAVGLRSIAVDSQERPLLSGGSVTKVVSGCSSGETAVSTGFVARLTANGSQDPSFGELGLRQIPEFSSFEQASLLPGGALLAVGLGKPRCANEGGGPPVVLTGFGPEGNLDPGFGFAGFRVIGYRSAPVVSLAPSGKILLLGAKQKTSQLVMRLLPNGAADPGFGRTGRVNLFPPAHGAIAALTADPSERMLFAGRVTKRASKVSPVARSSFLLGRMTPKGRIDRGFGHKGSVRTGFGGPSSSFATQVLVDAKGRIVVGGGVTTSALTTGGGFAIARYLGGR